MAGVTIDMDGDDEYDLNALPSISFESLPSSQQSTIGRLANVILEQLDAVQPTPTTAASIQEGKAPTGTPSSTTAAPAIVSPAPSATQAAGNDVARAQEIDEQLRAEEAKIEALQQHLALLKAQRASMIRAIAAPPPPPALPGAPPPSVSSSPPLPSSASKHNAR